MRKASYLLLTVATVLFAARSLPAGGGDVKPVVDLALKALGGEERLARAQGATWKGKGTVRFMGQPFDYSGDWFTRSADLSRVALQLKLKDATFTYAKVVNKEGAWVKINDGFLKQSKQELEELREEAYVRWVVSMLPLRQKEFKLEPLGEVRVGDQQTVGLKVSHKDHRPIDLFFDKATGVLVRSLHTVRDTGKELTQETLWSEFRKQDELLRPTRVVMKRDGEPYAEGELSDFRLLNELDDSTFAKP
ncbi:MAG: hypothetical protein L0Z62_07655 [Gemmataceae bacterium]|nr:hypothetical protein [Gemmataceae bacterium]